MDRGGPGGRILVAAWERIDQILSGQSPAVQIGFEYRAKIQIPRRGDGRVIQGLDGIGVAGLARRAMLDFVKYGLAQRAFQGHPYKL